MITDRVGRHELPLPIYHNFCQNLWYIGLFFFLIKTQEIPRPFFCQQRKKAISARVMARSVQLLRHMWRVPSYYTVLLRMKSGQLIANQIWEFFFRYDYGLKSYLWFQIELAFRVCLILKSREKERLLWEPHLLLLLPFLLPFLSLRPRLNMPLVDI